MPSFDGEATPVAVLKNTTLQTGARLAVVPDFYEAYTASSQTDPTGPATGDYRIMRGGGWNDFLDYLRSALRWWFGPERRDGYYGFRCVLPR